MKLYHVLVEQEDKWFIGRVLEREGITTQGRSLDELLFMVRDAIELLGADRIDHGVRAVEDPRVVALLAERRVPLGVCPTSNLKLGVVPSLEQHPIERLRHAGVAVSVNTDDPALLDTSLEQEYALCRDTFEWSDDDVWSVARTSIDASFANDDVKTRLRDALSRW